MTTKIEDKEKMSFIEKKLLKMNLKKLEKKFKKQRTSIKNKNIQKEDIIKQIIELAANFGLDITEDNKEINMETWLSMSRDELLDIQEECIRQARRQV